MKSDVKAKKARESAPRGGGKVSAASFTVENNPYAGSQVERRSVGCRGESIFTVADCITQDELSNKTGPVAASFLWMLPMVLQNAVNGAVYYDSRGIVQDIKKFSLELVNLFSEEISVHVTVPRSYQTDSNIVNTHSVVRVVNLKPGETARVANNLYPNSAAISYPCYVDGAASDTITGKWIRAFDIGVVLPNAPPTTGVVIHDSSSAITSSPQSFSSTAQVLQTKLTVKYIAQGNPNFTSSTTTVLRGEFNDVTIVKLTFDDIYAVVPTVITPVTGVFNRVHHLRDIVQRGVVKRLGDVVATYVSVSGEGTQGYITMMPTPRGGQYAFKLVNTDMSGSDTSEIALSALQDDDVRVIWPKLSFVDTTNDFGAGAIPTDLKYNREDGCWYLMTGDDVCLVSENFVTTFNWLAACTNKHAPLQYYTIAAAAVGDVEDFFTDVLGYLKTIVVDVAVAVLTSL